MSTAGTDRDWPALAHVVRERRLELGVVSQKAAAAKANVHVNTWNALENGKPVSMESLGAIAKALQWSGATLVAILREGVAAAEDHDNETPSQAGTARSARNLCEQAVRGAEAGWVTAEVGAFAAAVLARLDEEEAS